jgi:hypothetical protein
MFTIISAAAQPGIFPAAAPLFGMSLGSFPLAALVPFAIGAGLVAVLVLVARDEQARRTRAEARTDRPGETSLPEAA